MAVRHLNIRSREEAERALREIGVDPAGIACMSPKMAHLNLRLKGISPKAANVMKQDMLSLGGDAAVARGTVSCTIPETDVILMGTEKQLRGAVEKFKRQPFGLKKTAARLKGILDALSCGPNAFNIVCPKQTIDLSSRTCVMGILNVTPDSFSDGGSYLDPGLALDRACRMVEEGAQIIDIGGESTRPGAGTVPLEEEIGRVIPVIDRVARKTKALISVDTCKAEVAKRALDAGADIINDISGLRFDPRMAPVAAAAGCSVVVMHIQGTPKDMQAAPRYESLMDEIIDYLEAGIGLAAEAGVDTKRIIVDPGIGFGKRMEDNLAIIDRLDELKVLGRPVLVGISRKSFVGRVLDADVGDRLEGTLAASVLAIERGARILRTHDVKEAVRAARMADAVINSRDTAAC